MTSNLSRAKTPRFTNNVTRIAEWQRPDPATLPPDRRAEALWARLAPTIDYNNWFIEGALLRCPAEPFDHWQVVLHDRGQRAFLGEGRDVTRSAVDAFASECGMTVDYFGPGLWSPESTAVVLRVTDACTAAQFFGVPGAFGQEGQRFVVKEANRFMPPKARKART